MESMYDISKDYLYKEGRKQAKKDIIKNVTIRMLKDGTISIEKIAELLSVTTDYVKQVEKELKQ